MGAGGGITPCPGRDVSVWPVAAVGGRRGTGRLDKQPQHASPVRALKRLRALRARIWPEAVTE